LSQLQELSLAHSQVEGARSKSREFRDSRAGLLMLSIKSPRRA
jgi:hypothetical protein